MADIKDMCEVDRTLPIHQLNKINEKGTKREDIFPLSVVQAIFDKTGIRLDSIISSFNYIFLPYKGTKEDTRLQVVGLMRRKSLVICYRDLDDNITIEMYNSNDRGDDQWKLDDNWVDFEDWLIKVIETILGNLDDHPDLQETITNIINNVVNDIIDSWLDDNGETIINNWLETQNINNIITDSINQYIDSDEFKNKIEEIVNSWFEDNLDDALQGYFDDIQTYITTNERVVANALSRHEEDILNIKSE